MLESLDQDLLARDEKFSFDPNEVYYYNAQRGKELILRLQARYTGFDTQQVRRIFHEAMGIDDIVDIRCNTSFGTGHVVAFVDTADHTYVYRQTVGLDVPESYMLLEKDIADQFKSIGIGSVDILHYGSEPGFEWQIMEVLPGENITQFQGTQEQYDDLSRQVGKIIAMQYHLPVQGWGRIIKKDGVLQGYQKTHYDHFTAYLEYDLGILQLSQLIDEPSIVLLRNHLAGARVKEIFAHTQSYLIDNDLPDHNVRFDKDTMRVLAIYDLESAVMYDPVCELGSLPTWASLYPKKQQLKEGFLSYIAEAGLQDQVDLSFLDEKIALYFLRAIVWKMPFAIKGKKLSSRHIKLFKEALLDNGLSIALNDEAKNILVGDR